MLVPVGGLVTRLALPKLTHAPVRLALILGAGFLVTPAIVVFLGTSHRLRWYPALCAVLMVVWGSLEWRSRSRGRPSSWIPVNRGVMLITLLSLAAITPLMTPLRPLPDGSFVNYAYIDDFYHLNLVRSLTRDLPLSDQPDMAGSRVSAYPAYHHVIEATLARVAGVDAAQAAFVSGPVLLVILTILLSYAIGLAITGSPWGGYIAASLQYLVLIPNWYDRNLLLANQTVTLLPNFYQLHFYSLRYAAHGLSGDVVILTIVLAACVALSDRDDRTQAGALTLMSLGMAALLQFRPQFAVAWIPPSVLLQVGFLFWKRKARFAVPLAVLALLVLPAFLARGPDPTASGVIVEYGVFGLRVLRKGYLPDLASAAIGRLPDLVQPITAIAALVVLRIIGFNYVLLILWGVVHAARNATLRIYYLYLLSVIAVAAIAAASLEQEALAGNVGMNILMACRMPVVLLTAPALLALARRLRGRIEWIRTHPQLCAIAVLLVFTPVAYRGADAAMHDRLDRAYPITSGEIAAYDWLRTRTPAAAVVAAHPAHRVNKAGERIQDTNVLSGMTGRAAYLQRVTPFMQPEAERRRMLLHTLFSAQSADEVCRLADGEHFDYLIEYETEPLAARSHPCLALVFAGGPNIYLRSSPSSIR